MAKLLTSWLVIFTTIAFHNNNFNLSTTTIALAQLLVVPMWNESDVSSESCNIENYRSEDGFIFHGVQSSFCSVNVSSFQDSAVLVTFSNESIGSFTFVAESLESIPTCSAKYVVVREHNHEDCGIILRNSNTLIHLNGDISILLTEIPTASVGDDGCSQVDGYNVNLSSNVRNQSLDVHALCKNTEEFDDVILCNIHKTDNPLFPITCTYDVDSTYTSILTSKNEVKFQCIDDMNKTGESQKTIIYQGNVDMVDLSENNIGAVESRAFVSLINLIALDISINRLRLLESETFFGLDNCVVLHLERNQLTTLAEDTFQDVPNLQRLYLAKNGLSSVPANLFRGLHKLRTLFLVYNQLYVLNSQLFGDFKSLQILNVAHNRLVTLDDNMFQGIPNLRGLALHYNVLERLPFTIFNNLDRLVYLYLNNNKLKSLPDIGHLISLQVLNIEGNSLIDIGIGAFSRFPNTSLVIASQHEVCECYVSADSKCIASGERSPYLTCNRLFSDRVLVSIMWLIGVNALLGNAFVIVLNKVKSKGNAVQDRLLINLAISDFLMGIYMIVVASADIYFGEHFPMRAETWRSGITCRISGAISIISSEASVFFVTLISADKLFNIQFPYSTKKLTKTKVTLVIAFTWVFALLLGVIPSALSGINFKFYDNSHVCIGLPLALVGKYETYIEDIVTYVNEELILGSDHESILVGKLSGMYFATAVFLGLNGTCYLIILFSYIGILRAVKQSSKRIGRTQEMKTQIQMTAKVFAVVATDFCCWFPVIVLGILVQFRIIVLPPSVFAWLVTFVIPINSAINPYLYTISAVIGRYRRREHSEKSQNELNSVKTVSIAVTHNSDS